jgi:hypothetical protein
MSSKQKVQKKENMHKYKCKGKKRRRRFTQIVQDERKKRCQGREEVAEGRRREEESHSGKGKITEAGVRLYSPQAAKISKTV